MEEILQRHLLIRDRVFAAISTIEKAHAARKKSFRGKYVVQAWFRKTTTWVTSQNIVEKRNLKR